MPNIPSKMEFEPSGNARKVWLSTRKDAFYCGNQHFPGLFQTAEFNSDNIWVILSLLVEVLALGLTIVGGIQRGGIFVWISIATVFMFLFLDFIGIRWHHSPKATRCKKRNELVLASANQKAAINQELKKRYMKSTIGLFFLILSAILKILAVWLLLHNSSVFIPFILTILYLVVVYIHKENTGYWLSEIICNLLIRSDYKDWTGDVARHKQGLIPEDAIRNKSQIRQQAFESELALNNVNQSTAITINGHEISLRTQHGNKFEYLLKTKGILTDSDVQFLCFGQLAPQAASIGEACLELQMAFL